MARKRRKKSQFGESLRSWEGNPIRRRMLNQIKTAPTKSAAQDVVDLLQACHQKIRHFSGVATRLAHAQGVTPAEVAQAADGCYRYFSVALPLHEADENLSVHPRLRSAAPEGELAGPAADAMVDQHLAIDELVERLMPLLVLTRSDPEKLPEVAGEMCSISASLQKIFESHLKMEEEVIFPALRKYLSPEQLKEIVEEMQDRRKTG